MQANSGDIRPVALRLRIRLLISCWKPCTKSSAICKGLCSAEWRCFCDPAAGSRTWSPSSPRRPRQFCGRYQVASDAAGCGKGGPSQSPL